MFEHLVERIGDAVGPWLYVIAGGLCFAEAAILVGMVLPGETALLVAGVFCAAHKLNLWLMIVVAVACAIAGDSVGFEFGQAFGPRLRRSAVGRLVGERRWAAVDGFLHRHGGKAVLARPVDRAVPRACPVDGRHERDALPHLPDLERDRRR